MPVRIRLSRKGAKKRPFYRIVVADSRRARDGKFIENIGTYNPMLQKDNPERVKLDIEKAKEWIAKGAQPSDRVTLFLSSLGVVDKPIITEKTKKHLPRKKTQEKLAAAKKAEETLKAKEKEGSTTEQTEVPVDQPIEADSAKTDDVNKESDDANEEDVVVPETVDDSNSESSNEPKTKTSE